MDLLTSKEDPPTFAEIAKRRDTSRAIISIIVHQDLGKTRRKQAVLHALTDNHRRNRKRNCRTLYEHHLNGEKSQFVVILEKKIVLLG